MIKSRLTSGEIQDLINRYNSDLKKLEFQVEDIKMTIAGLEKLMNSVALREKASFAKVKTKKTKIQTLTKPKKTTSAAKAKSTTKSKQKTKPTPKGKAKTTKNINVAKKAVSKAIPKAKTKVTAKLKPKKTKSKGAILTTSGKKGYKLSDWDNYVIQSISESGKVRITSEILESVKNKMAAAGKKVTDLQVRNKVTRSLQKLVNNRGDLAKVSYQGKGLAYALPTWLEAKGKVSSEFDRK